jgi:hypothetical protein
MLTAGDIRTLTTHQLYPVVDIKPAETLHSAVGRRWADAWTAGARGTRWVGGGLDAWRTRCGAKK